MCVSLNFKAVYPRLDIQNISIIFISKERLGIRL